MLGHLFSAQRVVLCYSLYNLTVYQYVRMLAISCPNHSFVTNNGILILVTSHNSSPHLSNVSPAISRFASYSLRSAGGSKSQTAFCVVDFNFVTKNRIFKKNCQK